MPTKAPGEYQKALCYFKVFRSPREPIPKSPAALFNSYFKRNKRPPVPEFVTVTCRKRKHSGKQRLLCSCPSLLATFKKCLWLSEERHRHRNRQKCRYTLIYRTQKRSTIENNRQLSSKILYTFTDCTAFVFFFFFNTVVFASCWSFIRSVFSIPWMGLKHYPSWKKLGE